MIQDWPARHIINGYVVQQICNLFEHICNISADKWQLGAVNDACNAECTLECIEIMLLEKKTKKARVFITILLTVWQKVT